MNFILNLCIYTLAFIVVIGVVTLIHELGHYIVARLCGVRVEEFSIGFGKALKSWTDKHGTLWKIAPFPCGGYVKMFGDAGAESSPDLAKLATLSDADKQLSFHYQPAHKKLAIILAGPIMNFLLCIAILTVMFSTKGTLLPAPNIVDTVIAYSPAAEAGILPGDKITHVNWHKVDNFDEVKKQIALNTDADLVIRIERNGQFRHFVLTQRIVTVPNCDPNEVPRQQKGIGILSQPYVNTRVNVFRAVGLATTRTYRFSIDTLHALKDLIIGKRNVNELGGPIKIAQYSGESAKQGPSAFFWLIAIISANIGLMNLLPIPALDGGHCVFYLVEMITRREISAKLKERSTMICFMLLILLLVLITANDLRQLLF